MDLKNEPESIRRYEEEHRAVWPEVLQSIRGSGIEKMEIWRFETRLFMIMEVSGSFSFEKKAADDAQNPKVQEWEAFMSRFQQPLPGSGEGEKWRMMHKIFDLNGL